MIPINKPIFTTKEVFESCIDKVRNAAHKKNLENCITDVINCAIDFDSKFPQNEIYLIPQTQVVVAPIGKLEMVGVYSNGMLPSSMPGRKYYDKIMASAVDKVCPLCSVREADTIDHYLPKARYPIFSVTPINLVPACTVCNTDKKISFPTSNVTQTLHPYYDNVNYINWIKAKVLQTSPVAFDFYPDPPNYWNTILKDRVANHFNAYNLNEVFSSNANRRLAGDKERLMNLFHESPNLLLQSLWDSYNSNLKLGPNSYESIMYFTLAMDDWFCNEGVLL